MSFPSARFTLPSFTLAALLAGSGCSSSNNLLLGHVEATVGGHKIVVTDCYRISVPPPETIRDGGTGALNYRFAPCRDAEVLIREGEVSVNGQRYGKVGPKGSVLVDHGRVSLRD